MPEFYTTRFGTVSIEEKDLVQFEKGIPGFPEETKFFLVPVEENSPFIFMQSILTPDLAFLITNPFLFFHEYEFIIDDETMEELDLKSDKDFALYSILTMQGKDIRQMTANLVAPVIINVKNRQAKQLVLEKSKYSTKHVLFTASSKEGE